jgi:hypothetical protein
MQKPNLRQVPVPIPVRPEALAAARGGFTQIIYDAYKAATSRRPSGEQLSDTNAGTL